MMWGVWAPLEGQMRTLFPSVALTLGLWGVTVPLAVLTVRYGYLGVHADPTAECGAAECAAAGVSLAQAQLAASWWVANLGMLSTTLMMLWACLTADWAALSELAQRSAEIIEDRSRRDPKVSLTRELARGREDDYRRRRRGEVERPLLLAGSE